VKLVAWVPRVVDSAGPVKPRPGLLAGSEVWDLGGRGWPDVRALLTADGPLEPAGDPHPLGDVRLTAPLPRPGKIVCVGLNYHDHCREQSIDPPAYPLLFAKFANAIIDPGAPVHRPRATEMLDLECELAVVIGRPARHVRRAEALEVIFGYTIINDVTMRDLQHEDGQWLRAKGSDGFAPLGPMLVTRDELDDGRGVRIRSSVNGETWQDSSTDEMVFDVPTLVAFISRAIALEPGDLIATGTPAGVGHFQRPPRYLRGGDVMRCEIEGIGVLENPVSDELPRAGDHERAAGVAELMEEPT
jgi:2-keto-4-pentenoate hydratase/2-oxohepta-3-ene-1,7-dioic acid hydratase in catechol pathway